MPDLHGFSPGKFLREATLKGVTQGRLAQAALEAALDALEDSCRPLQFLEAERILRPLAQEVGVPSETFTKKVLDEARRWTEGVLDGFWEGLGVSSPPAEVAEALREWDQVKLWCPWGRKAPLGTLSVFVRGKFGNRYLRKDLDLPFPDRACSRSFVLWAHPGRVEVCISPRLFTRKERALFRTRAPRGIGKTLTEVAPFRPLFDAMGLPNLEEALEDLGGLKDGEIRQRGPYFLARKGRLRVLKRGSYFFDDPVLEARFLLGERVLLTYENGVEVALKGIFSGATLSLEEASIKWGDEVVQLRTADWGFAFALDQSVLDHLFRNSLNRSGGNAFPGSSSSRMRALIAELANEEAPLEALKQKDFLGRVWLNRLAHF